MTTECSSINAVIYSTKPAEYLRTPDGARANAVVLIWKCDWPEAKGISLATFHARLSPTRQIWDDWTRMAHNHIDRQAKGILSKRDFTKKPRSGQEVPPRWEKPELLNSTHAQAKSNTRWSIPPKRLNKQNTLSTDSSNLGTHSQKKILVNKWQSTKISGPLQRAALRTGSTVGGASAKELRLMY